MASASPETPNVIRIGRATGPKSERGKRIVARNALTHGLYSSATVLRHLEDPAEFERFARAVVTDFRIETALEMAFAERLISALWRQRRVRKYETAALSKKADLAAAIIEERDEARQRASERSRWRDAIYEVQGSVNVNRVVADDADAGVQQYLDDINQDEWIFDLGYDRFSPHAPRTVSRQRFYAATARLRRTLPPEVARVDRGAFFFACTLHLHRQAAEFSAKAEKLANAVEEKSTDALVGIPWNERLVADAESKLDRQISRYLNDLEQVRRCLLPASRCGVPVVREAIALAFSAHSTPGLADRRE